MAISQVIKIRKCSGARKLIRAKISNFRAEQMRKNLYARKFLRIRYEKALDFANRATIIKDMMKHNMGDKFVRAVADMYEENFYVPRIDRSMLGEPIQTFYGVTQG